jgi:hypothetical protein
MIVHAGSYFAFGVNYIECMVHAVSSKSHEFLIFLHSKAILYFILTF